MDREYYDSLAILVLDAAIISLDNSIVDEDLEVFSDDYKNGFHMAIECLCKMRDTLKEKYDGKIDDL